MLLYLTTKNADESTAVAPRSGRLPCNSLPVSHAIVFGGMVQWHGMAAAMNYVDFSGSGWSASRETVSRPKQQRRWARLDPERSLYSGMSGFSFGVLELGTYNFLRCVLVWIV